MFGTLTLLLGAGLLGPLLGAGRRGVVPVVAGELLGGLLIGHTGFDWVNPADPTLSAFSAVGFAMLMLTAGAHVDLRDPVLRSGMARGAIACIVVAVLAVPAGVAINAGAGLGDAPLLVVLLAGSSAAVALPIIEERHVHGPAVAFAIGWLALADTATVVIMPLTLRGGGDIVVALLGDLAIIALAVPVIVAAALMSRTPAVREVERESLQRSWALLLRLSALILLGFAAIAERSGASQLVAGFAAGLVLAQLREPERLSVQLTGLANGFFVPLYFVLLGAKLDVRGMLGEPRAIALALAMAAGAVVVHVLAGLATAPRRRVAVGLIASAQLGMPAAAATLALDRGVLPAPYAAAIVAGAILTLIPATLGTLQLANETRPGPAVGTASGSPN